MSHVCVLRMLPQHCNVIRLTFLIQYFFFRWVKVHWSITVADLQCCNRIRRILPGLMYIANHPWTGGSTQTVTMHRKYNSYHIAGNRSRQINWPCVCECIWLFSTTNHIVIWYLVIDNLIYNPQKTFVMTETSLLQIVFFSSTCSGLFDQC